MKHMVSILVSRWENKESNVGSNNAFLPDLRVNIPKYTQLRDIWNTQKKLALTLRSQGKTQQETAEIVGIDQRTIGRWEDNNISNRHMPNAYIPDLRVMIPTHEQTRIVKRHQNGDTQQQLADDYKVSQPRISQIIKKAEKKDKLLQLRPFQIF